MAKPAHAPAPVFASLPQAGQGQGQPGGKKKTHPLAIVALIGGILFFPVGIICGHMARSRIRKDPSLAGKGMALAGLILGYLQLTGLVAIIALVVVVGASFLKAFNEGMEEAKAAAATNEVAGANSPGPAGQPKPAPAPSQSPEEVVRAYLEASKKADLPAAKALVTQKAQERMGDVSAINIPGAANLPSVQYDISGTVTNADYVSVQLHLAVQNFKMPMQMRLRQENGQWRIFGQAILADDKQAGVFVDLEGQPDMAALRSQLMAAMAKMMPGANPAAQTLDVFSQEQFEAAGKIELNAADQPAIEVLTPLAQTLGITLAQTAKQESQLSKGVTVKGEGKTPLGIIEEIGRQIERLPSYAGARLTFRRDARVNPVEFSGPLMLEVEAVDRGASGAGEMKLALRGFGLPLPVVAFLREPGNVKVTVTSVGDGQNADYADRAGRIIVTPDRNAAGYVASISAPLAGLTEATSQIPQAKVRATLALPAAVEPTEFARLEAGTTQKAGSVQVTLVKITGSTYQFDIEGAQAGRVQFSARSEAGAPLKAALNVTSATEAKSTVNVQVTGKPTTITAYVVTAVSEVVAEFVLRDLPIKGGAAPATVVAKAPGPVAPAPAPGTAAPAAPTAPAPAAKAPPGTGTVNIMRLSHPVASTSSEASNLSAESAADGDLKSRWNSGNNDAKGAWIGSRWDEPVTINRLVIRQAFDRITGFRIQKLDEEKDEWVDVTVVEGAVFGQIKGRIAPGKNPMDSSVNPVFNVNLPAPVTTRGLRVLVTGVSNFSYSVSIFELEAF